MKPIVGYEDAYKISPKGEIYSEHLKDFLKPSSNSQVEYLQVSLWKGNKGTSFYVHRLVAIHFIPNPLGLPEVNHIDGNRLNNDVTNLEWVTSSGNSIHAVKTGLRTYTNRLTKEEFHECLLSVIEGESYQSLSERVPYKVPFLSTKLRKLAKELGLEVELNMSLKSQRANRNREVLSVINSKRVTTRTKVRTLK